MDFDEYIEDEELQEKINEMYKWGCNKFAPSFLYLKTSPACWYQKN